MVQNENVNIQILSLNANPLQEEQDSLQISDARVSNTFTLDLCLMPNLQRLYLINYKIEELHISDNCINDSRINDDHDNPHSLRILESDSPATNENGMIDFPKITAPDLDSLDLSKNEIKFLTQEVFEGIPRIRCIDLSSNHIKSITADTFVTSIYIRELNLENNQIHHISESAFINQRGGFILRLGNNHLVSILPSSLPVLSRTVYLDPNPWNCDCESTSIKRWLLLSGVNLYQCMNPLYLKNMSLVSLNETGLCHDEYGDFKSTVTQTSLSMSSGIRMVKKEAFQGSTNLTHLDIRGNYLMMIPDLSSFPRLFYLDLSGNLLERIRKEDLNNLTNLCDNGIIDFPKITAPELESLDLSKNEIKFLTQEVFEGIPRIRYIDLSSNHIKSITADTFVTSIYIRELNLENNQIHHISESAFINQRGGFILRLGNNHLVSILPSSLPVLSRTVYLDPNPWNCVCESTSIKRWLLLSGVNLYQCMNPSYLRNMSLVSLDETDLCSDEYGDFKSTETQTSLNVPSGVNRILYRYCLKFTWALHVLLSSYLSLAELSYCL
ncbi:slit homolog 3 protein-like [Lytechinus variegatus]|uniref:slit homolog 3 protein-like n=1 Tax=Lytechinus variegatus TaxID=7654 RepID=UPI001BB2444B|nr:slit homolog 3 protein-like [Lytechinus variegatus]